MEVETLSFTLCCSETGYIYQGEFARPSSAAGFDATITETLQTIPEASDTSIVIKATNIDLNEAFEAYNDFTAIIDIKFEFAGSEETVPGTLLVIGSEHHGVPHVKIINNIV